MLQTQTPPQSGPLVRKQILLSPTHIEKLEALAKDNHTSFSEVVRNAIDSYGLNEIEQSDLMALVATRLNEAIEDTKRTRRKLNNTLAKLDT